MREKSTLTNIKNKAGAGITLVALSLLSAGNLQAQTNYSFTTAGATGVNGPSQGQVNTAYQLTNLNGLVTSNGGVQTFIIPSTGPYRITATGAQGGQSIYNGGMGAKVVGDFTFTAGQVLNIVVGQKGGNESGDSNRSGGGGGGSFVYTGSTLHVAAGGGGGKCGYSGGGYNFSTVEANTITAGNAGSNWNLDGGGAGGDNGNGGTSPGCGAAGAGWLTAGSPNWGMEGQSLSGGWIGGTPSGFGGSGGFGGGGAGGDCYGGGGGGGGYSGGGGGDDPGSGGGAGSYNAGINQIMIPGINTNDGMVVLTKLYGVEIAQSGSIACFGQTNVTLTAQGTGGAAPYTYTWAPGGATTAVLANVGAGVYTCSITDQMGEQTFNTHTVTQPSQLTGTINNVNNVACNGGINGSAHVAAGGGVSPYQYAWIPNGGNASTAFGLGANTYTVYVLDQNACQISKTVTITQPLTSIGVNATNLSICPAGSVVLTGTGSTTYTWTGGITNGVLFTPTITSTYTVTGTNTLTGCTHSMAVTVTVNPQPVINVAGSTSICPGQIISLYASGGATYTWQPGNQTGFFINVSPTVNTTYSVSGRSEQGCYSAGVTTLAVAMTTCVGIDENQNELTNLLVYPNPTTGEFVVELDNGSAKTATVFDVTGRAVKTAATENKKLTMNIVDLSNGVYYLKIESENASRIVKLVKQ